MSENETRALVTERDFAQAPPPSSQDALLQVISRVAADRSVDLDRIERLLQMHQQMEQRQSEREFTAAMAQFKCNPPKIVKDKLVSFTTQKGTTHYRHATLGAVCEAAIAGLAAVGISHRWDLKRDGARIIVTCILTHRAGHSQSTTMDGPLDDSGSKNAIQQASSTVTYLERYTLLAATGLATDEQDDDGRGGEALVYVSESQVADLTALIEEVGANKQSLLKFLGYERLESIPAGQYESVVKIVERKRRRVE